MKTNYKCPACANGVIVRSATKKKDVVTVVVYACNVCANYIGIKGIEKLKLVE